MPIFTRLGSVLLFGALLSGCATANFDSPENDPFEEANRRTFEATLAIDRAVMRPVATTYRDTIPVPVQTMLRNFLDNLTSPGVLVNDFLQGEPERAGTTLERLIINTTFGIGGVIDIAEVWGRPKHREDFGQTLAVWGVGEGPYLVIPLLGPTNSRDLLGRGVDFFFDPFTYIEWGDESYVPWVRLGVDQIDFRARALQQVEDIERTSADFYAATRSLYRQNRENLIANGEVDVEELPDF
jgi:phospholipid-binding lipoprotein MlaA